MIDICNFCYVDVLENLSAIGLLFWNKHIIITTRNLSEICTIRISISGSRTEYQAMLTYLGHFRALANLCSFQLFFLCTLIDQRPHTLNAIPFCSLKSCKQMPDSLFSISFRQYALFRTQVRIIRNCSAAIVHIHLRAIFVVY